MNLTFLKAEWKKLIMINYAVSPHILDPYVPAGTQLDFYREKCYVSIVGFLFCNTKVFGITIPAHHTFEEVNLRFYVQRMENGQLRRGTVFVREIVPKIAVAFVANTFYRENYVVTKMDHQIENTSGKVRVEYLWRWNNEWQSFSVDASEQRDQVVKGSEAHFIFDHFWGYTRISDHITSQYEVTHPSWDQFEVENFRIDVDFGSVYGSEFSQFTYQEPDSIFLFEGSPIMVKNRSFLKV